MTPVIELGITVPLDPALAEHRPVFETLDAAGYTSFWTAETAGNDAFTPLALAAGILPQAELGTAIASVFTRGPALLAMTAAALAEAAPGRFALGIGTSAPVIVDRWNNIRFDRPFSRVRDTLRFLRSALAGERVSTAYDTFRVDGFRLERPPAVAPPILIAALGPRMLGLAGAEADGVVLTWLSAGDVRSVLGVVEAGGSVGRVVTRVLVCPSEDAPLVRAAARRLIAGYVTVPAYEAFHRWLGRDAALQEVWAAWAATDRRGAAEAVPDQVVDDLVVHGGPDECAEHIAEYMSAGVTTPVVKIVSLDPAVEQLAGAIAVARAVRDRG